MQQTSLLSIGVSKEIADKLKRQKIENTNHLNLAWKEMVTYFTCLTKAEEWELVQRLALYNINPPWIYEYSPPITPDTRKRATLSKGHLFISGPYAQSEMWMLIRAIASLEVSKIKWLVAQMPGGMVELWRVTNTPMEA